MRIGDVRVATLWAAVGAAALVVACTKPAPEADLADRWWAHVAFLADDGMRGRETGSEEHRKAAEYVAAQFKEAGLEPAGTQDFLQPVAFTSRRILEDQSSLALVSGTTVRPVALGDEATISMRVAPAPKVEAPLVFAGYGLAIPEIGHDDFADVDVAGKIVVYISGSPAATSGPLSAHYQSAAVRWEALRRRGALGTVAIPNPSSMDVPWERSSPNRLNAAMSLADSAADDTAGQQIAVTFNPARADRLLEGTGHTLAQLLALADRREPLPRFPLTQSLRAVVAVDTHDAESHNVVGLVRGSDAERANEYVVLTAHLDHVGVGAPIAGDAIYNGAMDNASGVATLIEAGKALAGTSPRRSLLFVAVTGEEKGLLGSRYFATQPTVEKQAIVANVNMDMFLPLFPLRSLMVLGLDESDLGTDIRAVAESMGLSVQADPEPLRNRFVRSDQYSFIREGVPALAMKVGFEPGSPEDEVAARWTRERYHAPSDDLAQPIDREAAAGFTRVISQLVERIANRAERPRWNDDSFFKRFAVRPPPT